MNSFYPLHIYAQIFWKIEKLSVVPSSVHCSVSLINASYVCDLNIYRHRVMAVRHLIHANYVSELRWLHE